jgi:hypothetical protein
VGVMRCGTSVPHARPPTPSLPHKGGRESRVVRPPLNLTSMGATLVVAPFAYRAPLTGLPRGDRAAIRVAPTSCLTASGTNPLSSLFTMLRSRQIGASRRLAINPLQLALGNFDCVLTRRLRGPRRDSCSSQIRRPRRAPLQQATPSPGGSTKHKRPRRACARSIRRFGFPISGKCSRFAGPKISRDSKTACEKPGCRSDRGSLLQAEPSPATFGPVISAKCR